MSYFGTYSSMLSEPLMSGTWDDYRWMVVCGALAAFFMAWGIGANDVANSFATSVGSRTLKLWQAMIIAGIFEFVGALALGGETTKTIASDISNVIMYDTAPEIYMYGMLCALTIAGVWLLVATYYLLPVSTTHSIIGSIMGFSLVFGGWNGVLWNQEKGDFPYSKGFLPVVLSWFFSPIMAGILAAIIYNLNRFFILRRSNSTMKAIYSLPILLFFTFFINIMFVLAKGAKSQMAKTWPCDPKGGPGMFGLYYEDCSDLNAAAAWIAACVGAFIGIVGGGIGIWMLKRRYASNLAAEESQAVTLEEGVAAPLPADGTKALPAVSSDGRQVAKVSVDIVSEADEAQAVGGKNAALAFPTYPEDAGFLAKAWFYVSFLPICFYIQCKRGLFFDIFDGHKQDTVVKAIHANAERFNPQTELVYQSLQVISACCVSFAHGSNDVANAIGPFSAIFKTYTTFAVPGSNTTTPEWMFVLGGVGIVLGLLMYGYNIIAQLGVNMLHLTPSRGFSAELATGLTVSLASFFGIPVSTTQIIVGAEVGVGISEGLYRGLNWIVFLQTALGWVWTIVVSLGFCACLFSMGAYAPSIIQTQQINDYRVQLLSAHESMLKDMNKTNFAWQQSASWWSGTVAPPMLYNGSNLSPFINSSLTAIKGLKAPKKYVSQDQVMYYVAKAQALYHNYSITAIGQSNASAIVGGAAPYVVRPEK